MHSMLRRAPVLPLVESPARFWLSVISNKIIHSVTFVSQVSPGAIMNGNVLHVKYRYKMVLISRCTGRPFGELNGINMIPADFNARLLIYSFQVLLFRVFVCAGDVWIDTHSHSVCTRKWYVKWPISVYIVKLRHALCTYWTLLSVCRAASCTIDASFVNAWLIYTSRLRMAATCSIPADPSTPADPSNSNHILMHHTNLAVRALFLSLIDLAAAFSLSAWKTKLLTCTCRPIWFHLCLHSLKCSAVLFRQISRRNVDVSKIFVVCYINFLFSGRWTTLISMTDIIVVLVHERTHAIEVCNFRCSLSLRFSVEIEFKYHG